MKKLELCDDDDVCMCRQLINIDSLSQIISYSFHFFFLAALKICSHSQNRISENKEVWYNLKKDM